MAEHFRHNALFVGGNVREAVNAGRADYTPIFLSEIEALFESGEMPIDVAFIKIGANGQGTGGHWRVERDVLEAYIAGKYEENRRRNLWNQAEFADIPELFAERDR